MRHTPLREAFALAADETESNSTRTCVSLLTKMTMRCTMPKGEQMA